LYNKNAESGILWNDTVLGIKWPIENPTLSDKDKNAQTLAEWSLKPDSNLIK
jgi:dTDP-4-dehydrorhamnose 3,5-epimerase